VGNGTNPNAMANYTMVIQASDFSSGPPPSGTVASVYSFQLTTGLFGPPMFFTNPTDLPPGLTLSSSGLISGTPTQAGSFPVTFDVDTMFDFGTASYVMEILPTPVPAVITSSAPVDGTAGTAYSFAIAASGVPAAAFAIASGNLPPGLTLNTATGAISGVPTQAGTWQVTLSATSAGTAADTAAYTVTIAAADVASVPAAPASSASNGPIGLPTTGTDPQEPLGFAILLLLAGAGMFAVARRRNATRMQPGREEYTR
jgi:LPXTG-motif cell wall-anchored protein